MELTPESKEKLVAAKTAGEKKETPAETGMKLTPESKEKLEAAKTAEEKKKTPAETGTQLTDEEMEKAAGGIVVTDWKYVDIEIVL